DQGQFRVLEPHDVNRPEDAGHLGLPRGAGRGGKLDLPHEPVDDRGEDLLLGADVAVERHDPDAAPLRQPAHGHGLEAFVANQFGGDIDELVQRYPPVRPGCPGHSHAPHGSAVDRCRTRTVYVQYLYCKGDDGGPAMPMSDPLHWESTDPRVLWSPGNVSEAIPGVSTTPNWSFVGDAIELARRRAF